MDCHSQRAPNALLHPPAAQATPRVSFHRNRQTLPGEVWSDGSGEAPLCRSNSIVRSGEQAEEHLSERHRELHHSLDAGLEEVPARNRAGFGHGRFFRGCQAEYCCLWYLTGLMRGEGEKGEERRGGKKTEEMNRRGWREE